MSTSTHPDFPMALAAGTRLGPYEVLAAIGAGGMGEVYRARDTKLNRDVALKVLPGLPSPSIPTGSRASSAKRRCWPRSIIRTSPRSTASKNRTALGRRSCWSWSRDRRSPIASRSGPIARRRGAADRAADRGGARSGARARDHPSRSQAREYQAATRRHGEGAGLRPREGAGAPAGTRAGDARRRRRRSRSPAMTADGRDPWHRRLHEPRAGEGAPGRQAERRVGVRRRALRDAVGPARVQGRRYRRHARGGPAAGRRLDGASRVDARVGAAPDRAVSRSGRQAAAARHRRSADRAGRSRRDRRRRRGRHGRPRAVAASVATRDSRRARRDRGRCTGRHRRVVLQSQTLAAARGHSIPVRPAGRTGVRSMPPAATWSPSRRTARRWCMWPTRRLYLRSMSELDVHGDSRHRRLSSG